MNPKQALIYALALFTIATSGYGCKISGNIRQDTGSQYYFNPKQQLTIEDVQKQNRSTGNIGYHIHKINNESLKEKYGNKNLESVLITLNKDPETSIKGFLNKTPILKELADTSSDQELCKQEIDTFINKYGTPINGENKLKLVYLKGKNDCNIILAASLNGETDIFGRKDIKELIPLVEESMENQQYRHMGIGLVIDGVVKYWLLSELLLKNNGHHHAIKKSGLGSTEAPGFGGPVTY